MAALDTGALAPQISLPTTGGAHFSLQEALQRGPVVAAFFKITCPTCQLALPYFERLFQTYGGGSVTFVGVSQNERDGAVAFAREYGLTFPIALDDTSRYPASNAYGLTNVPTVFFIAPGGRVEMAIVGWSKRDMEELNARLAQAAGSPRQPLFRPGEDVPDFKAG